jgi:hypothetical protein
METVTLEKISLSEADKKILETPSIFYEYLKKHYGIEGRDDAAVHETIFASKAIASSEFPQGLTPTPSWEIHLEKFPSEIIQGVEDVSLIFGVHHLGIRNQWARLVEIKSTIKTFDGNYHARCRYKIIANNLFEKESERRQRQNQFYAVGGFLVLMTEFLKQY